jgi:hypothetical protein
LVYLDGQGFVTVPAHVLQAVKDFKPGKNERRYFKITTHKPKPFLYIFQIFWSQHVRSSSSNNILILLLTLPQFLKDYWRFKHWHQVPLFLCRRIVFHFKKDCLGG